MTEATVGTSTDTAAKLLKEGKLVAIPTETVYGLAGNALDTDTVVSIFEAKGRPRFDPLIVHVASWEKAQNYLRDAPPQAEALARNIWPGPLTLLLPKKDIIPDIVTSGLDRVGLRCPDHPLTRDLLSRLDFPLAAPSANAFGYVSPTTADHVRHQLGRKIPYILDGGPCRVGIESTIVGWEDGQPVVYRLGGIGVEQIESLVGPAVVRTHSSSQPQAPGQLQKHYAPAKLFYLGDIDQLIQQHQLRNPGILSFRTPYPAYRNQLVLSPSGDLHEAARNLFGMLRSLDQSDVDAVVAEEVPEKGLGRAINDRLRRAAAQHP
ncbi:MAG: threonylcarbamoyl-AMP synthase [Cyclobacteriaceae bacterium]|nr:threonylcarbamoyl-AMP synthase [Cyclobacteriaceae bacterium]